MIVASLKFYPLPDGRFVVSYFDDLRKVRVQNIIDEERRAKELYAKLKTKKSAKDEKRNFKNCSVEDLFEVFLEEVPDAKVKRSPRLIREFLEQFALFKPEHIDETKLRSFFTQQKIENDYTDHSLSTRKYQLQAFFKWMKKRGVIESSPLEGIVFGRGNIYKRKPIHIKPEKIAAAISKAKILSPGFLYPILLLISEAAARTSEVINLKWSDVDFKKKQVRFWEGEKIQRRELQISDDLANALKQIEQVSEYVFTNLDSRPHVKNVLTRELRQFQVQAKIDTDWAYRDLRFSYGVNFLQAGGNIYDLQHTLGHLHPRMTEELYGAYKVEDADFFESEGVRGTGR